MDRLTNGLNWFDQFDGNYYRLTTDSKCEYMFSINKVQIPHLMGLQYLYPEELGMKGSQILRDISRKNITYKKAIRLVKKNNPDKLESFIHRATNIQSFFENLENGYIVEKTNEKTRIQSTHLIVQDHNGGFLELGLKPIEGHIYVPETFIQEISDRMFSETSTKDKIVSISVMEFGSTEFVTTSFNAERRREIELNRAKETEIPLKKPKAQEVDYNILAMKMDRLCSEYNNSLHNRKPQERSIDDDFCR